VISVKAQGDKHNVFSLSVPCLGQPKQNTPKLNDLKWPLICYFSQLVRLVGQFVFENTSQTSLSWWHSLKTIPHTFSNFHLVNLYSFCKSQFICQFAKETFLDSRLDWISLIADTHNIHFLELTTFLIAYRVFSLSCYTFYKARSCVYSPLHPVYLNPYN
jgi:hypothetical protein